MEAASIVAYSNCLGKLWQAMMDKLLSYTLILHRPPTLTERFLHKMEAVKPLLHLVISCSCIELHQRSASYMATCVLHIWQVGALSLPRYGAHYGLWHTGWSTPAVMWSIWAIQLLLVQYFAPDTIKYIFPWQYFVSFTKPEAMNPMNLYPLKQSLR